MTLSKPLVGVTSALLGSIFFLLKPNVQYVGHCGMYLQVRKLSATALVGIDARPVPDMASLQQLATYIERCIKAHGSAFVQADSLMKAAKSAEKTLSAAASNSFMYV